MNNKRINLNYIADWKAKDNFDAIKTFVNSSIILSTNWKLFDITFDAAVTNYRQRHGFDFTPLDVITTSSSGTGTATFNFGLFNDEYIDITTTGACKIRFLVGTISAKRGEVL